MDRPPWPLTSREKSPALADSRASRLPARWWAHLLGALGVHPRKHCANYPLQKVRGADERPRCRREELSETENADHRRDGEDRPAVTVIGRGRGLGPCVASIRPRPSDTRSWS